MNFPLVVAAHLTIQKLGCVLVRVCVCARAVFCRMSAPLTKKASMCARDLFFPAQNTRGVIDERDILMAR
jgi:hypothetical protein